MVMNILTMLVPNKNFMPVWAIEPGGLSCPGLTAIKCINIMCCLGVLSRISHLASCLLIVVSGWSIKAFHST